MPYGTNIPFHIITPNIFRKLRLDWGWIWSHIDHHKSMYELGYQDAKQNIEIMNNIIL